MIYLLCFSFLLTGCTIGNKEVIVSNTLNNRQVFKIGSVSCGLKEAKVYLVNYQNIYGTAYGLDLWQHDFCMDDPSFLGIVFLLLVVLGKQPFAALVSCGGYG